MLQVKDQLDRLGAAVIAVSFTRPDKVAEYLNRYPLPFSVVCDPTLSAYKAFGLGRTSWATLVRPRVILGFLKILARGRLPKKPMEGDDVLQLGGNFVLDRQRRLVFAYRSHDPTDRPSPSALVEAARTAAQS